MQRSDEELMLSSRDGDQGAFEILYRRYEKPVFSFAYRMVMSAGEAEDLCQETFLRVARARRKYETTGKFKTWLFRIVLNLCHDRLRRRKLRAHLSLNAPAPEGDCEGMPLHETIGDPSSDPVQRAEAKEMTALVQQAFTALPEQQRTVVVLREYHALKFAEIAEILHCPVGTVKALNHRARQKLMERLSKYID
jgi:RNA polymerase sigma-70 factor (ECF subfamily)